MVKGTSKAAQAATAALTRQVAPPQWTDPKARISTGCTLLNLACSGFTDWATAAGQYIYFVGDSASGKTMLVMQLFAEAARNPYFDGYNLIFDNAENGALMDIPRLFGKRAAARMRSPARGNSKTVEEFYYSARSEMDATPCLYILDSMDCLGTRAGAKKQVEMDVEIRGGKKAKGTYGMDKARANSDGLRDLMDKLRDTGSLLVVISQTRDNVDAGLFEPKKQHSGGHALDFYAHLTIWTSNAGTIKKQVNAIDRPVGITVKAAVKKNRVNGLQRTIQVPLYPSVGVDDLGGCIAYLLTEGRWKMDGGAIITEFLDPTTKEPIKGNLEKVVAKLEALDLEGDVRAVVQEVWDEVESRCRINRKSRYE
jgi:RecA/RadA recombinase